MKRVTKKVKQVKAKPVKVKAKVVKTKAKPTPKPVSKPVNQPIPQVVNKPKDTIKLNVPTTKEQQAGVASVVNGSNFEGVKDISKLSLSSQIDTVFNPLHTITKTTLTDNVSESTFIVSPSPKPQG